MADSFSEQLIGREIPWDSAEGDFLRITALVPLAMLDGDKVRALSHTAPYRLANVISPKLTGSVVLPLVHRTDFANLTHALSQISQDEEVLVSYNPEYRGLMRPFSGWLPRLCIFIYAKGSLERLYDLFEGRADTADLPQPFLRIVPLQRYR
jgi:hypothetical protein